MNSGLKAFVGLLVVAGIGALLYFGFLTKNATEESRKRNEAEQATADAAEAAKGPQIDIRIRAGGEKIGFLKDPVLIALLRDRYRLTVSAEKSGSVEMSRDLPVQGFDALWPANDFCRQLVVERSMREGFKVVKSEDIFNSPIVILSWPDPVRVFSSPSWKVVEKRNEIHYVVDMAKLVDLVEKDHKWKDPDIGLPYNGRVLVKSTDPVKSSSGNLFAGLLANVMNGGDPAVSETIDAILPRVKSVFARMGLKEESSGTFFEHFLGMGVGTYPFGVAYENQLLELTLEQPASADVIRSNVTVLYPEPTVWATHPMVALTPAGKRLVDAMKDPEIQRIAWERHGFRTGAMGSSNDPAVFQMRGIPQQIVSVVPLPEPAVMSKILEALSAP
ncbi:MAG: hypothetical protein NTY35_01640 [Planctomycetota bacterium]|nr:hypothetical protein [Planctomycetota bacterium]